jgi:hypothetical protein
MSSSGAALRFFHEHGLQTIQLAFARRSVLARIQHLCSFPQNAEFERELIRERTHAGRVHAKNAESNSVALSVYL